MLVPPCLRSGDRKLQKGGWPKYRHRRRGLKPRLPEMVWPHEGEISSCLRSGERKLQKGFGRMRVKYRRRRRGLKPRLPAQCLSA